MDVETLLTRVSSLNQITSVKKKQIIIPDTRIGRTDNVLVHRLADKGKEITVTTEHKALLSDGKGGLTVAPAGVYMVKAEKPTSMRV